MDPSIAPNAIGNFEIGVSPIGDLPAFDPLATVVSQYANSPTLLALVGSFFACVDQTANFEAFFDLVWNVDTAQGYGLDVWGRIVGVSRVLEVASTQYLGFEEAGDPGLVGFNQQPFYSGAPTTSNYALTDAAFRPLVLAKAAANICDGSIKAINQVLRYLFPGKSCYVTDGGETSRFFGFGVLAGQQSFDGFNQSPLYSGGGPSGGAPMTMQYIFNFQLTPVQFAVVTQSGVLPKPTGVSATVIINP